MQLKKTFQLCKTEQRYISSLVLGSVQLAYPRICKSKLRILCVLDTDADGSKWAGTSDLLEFKGRDGFLVALAGFSFQPVQVETRFSQLLQSLVVYLTRDQSIIILRMGLCHEIFFFSQLMDTPGAFRILIKI